MHLSNCNQARCPEGSHRAIRSNCKTSFGKLRRKLQSKMQLCVLWKVDPATLRLRVHTCISRGTVSEVHEGPVGAAHRPHFQPQPREDGTEQARLPGAEPTLLLGAEEAAIRMAILTCK